MLIAANFAFAQGQGPDLPGDPNRPEGCYYLGNEAGRGYVDKCVGCTQTEIMQQIQPPSLCESVLQAKSQYGCCPICWIVIDPVNFRIMINYLKDLYWGRGWQPAGDNTGLAMLLAAVDTTEGAEQWGIYIPKTNQFVISNTAPQKVPTYDTGTGVFSGYTLYSDPNSQRVNINDLELTNLIRNWLQIPINPCSLLYGPPFTGGN